MKRFFSPSGRTARLPYVLGSFALLLSQHLFTLAVMRANEIPLDLNLEFVVLPVRTLLTYSPLSTGEYLLTLGVVFLTTWWLVVLAFRRAKDAATTPWLPVAVIAPIVQLFSIGVLALVPPRERAVAPLESSDPSRPSAWSENLWGQSSALH